MSLSIDKGITRISEIIERYAKEVEAEAVNKLDETADKIIDYIKANAPRGKSNKHLADSFVKTEIGEGANKVIYISSKTKSSLVHLIELGFKHRNGKHVAARPFLRPAYDEFTPKMVEDIRKMIAGG